MRRHGRSFFFLGAALVAIAATGVLVSGNVITLADLSASGADARCLAEDAGAGDSDPHRGMVWIPGGRFRMGSNAAYAEEAPAHEVSVKGFWMDIHEVTNAQFAAFVDATGYVTLAERKGESVVFLPPTEMKTGASLTEWWQLVKGADWRHPEGPGSDIEGREQLPVIHIAYEDAAAYADWMGRELPSEAQFEFAALGGNRKTPDGRWAANSWQGFFPFKNDALDGYAGLAPVGCFPANAKGLYDMIGNAWEWTRSDYAPSHDGIATDAAKVIKGGSYLCAPNYCARYRPEARQAQETGLGASHTGFRTVLSGG